MEVKTTNPHRHWQRGRSFGFQIIGGLKRDGNFVHRRLHPRQCPRLHLHLLGVLSEGLADWITTQAVCRAHDFLQIT